MENTIKKNETYRFLNWKCPEMEEKYQELFKSYIKKIIEPFNGKCEIGTYTRDGKNYISFKITFSDYSNKNIEILLPDDHPGPGWTVWNGTIMTNVSQYFGDFSNPNFGRGGCLIVPMDNGGVISVPVAHSPSVLPCLSTYANYLIFTWVEDIRTKEKFPCVLYEDITGADNIKRVTGLVFQDSNPNFDTYFQLQVQINNTSDDFQKKYPYPVLSQMTIPFDQYFFPDLFKKETEPEGSFGTVLIQKEKYFLTNSFAFKMKKQEGVL